MSSSTDALRSQRRRELDARRSKSRVRLGSCLQSWGQLKEKLGFSLHSELAQHLLESYVSRVCIKCSGNGQGEITSTISTTKESLQELILLVHNHGRMCLFPPVLHSRTVTKPTEPDQTAHATGRREAETDSKNSSEVDICLKYTCEDRHHFLWSPIKMEKVMTSKNESEITASSPKILKQRGRRQLKEEGKIERQKVMMRLKRRQLRENAEVTTNDTEQKNETQSQTFRDKSVTVTEIPETQKGNNVAADVSHSEHGSPTDSDEMTGDNPARVCSENPIPPDSNEEVAVLNLINRGIQSRADTTEKCYANKKAGTLKKNSPQSLKDDVSQIGGKRKRKSTSKVILPCEFEGCDKIFSSRQYLNVSAESVLTVHDTFNSLYWTKTTLREEKLYFPLFCTEVIMSSTSISSRRPSPAHTPPAASHSTSRSI